MKTIKFSDFMNKTYEIQGITDKEQETYDSFKNLMAGLLIILAILKMFPLIPLAPFGGFENAFLQF